MKALQAVCTEKRINEVFIAQNKSLLFRGNQAANEQRLAAAKKVTSGL